MTDTEVAHAHTDGGHAHPSDLQYVYIAMFLAFVTAAEVGASYANLSSTVLIALLVPMMVVKFATVAAFFMHLRFDSKIFRYFFLTGICVATACYLIILTTFHFWSGG
jgi:cytochrome c oxidase subunit 4